MGSSFVGIPSLRRRSVGPRRTDIHVLTALSPHPCGSAHCASSAFGLHPSRDWRCLGFLCTKIKNRSKASRLKPVPLCRRAHHFRCLCLCFCFCSSNAKGSNTAKRDLGAGRAQVLRSGPSRMDAARAPSGHGCPFGAGPRSKTGAREFRRRRNLARSRHPLLLGVLFQVTRRRRNVCR